MNTLSAANSLKNKFKDGFSNDVFKNAGKPNILDIYVTSATQNISNAELFLEDEEIEKSLSNNHGNLR